VSVTVKLGSRKVKLGSVSFAIAAGKTKRVTVRMSRTTLHRIVRRHRLAATATITLRKAGGGVTTTRRSFTVRR
jgi:hypothetical protein